MVIFAALILGFLVGTMFGALFNRPKKRKRRSPVQPKGTPVDEVTEKLRPKVKTEKQLWEKENAANHVSTFP